MKKIILACVGVALLAGVVVAVIAGQRYYNDRYVSSNYYTVVPSDYDLTPVMHYGDDGKEMGLGVTYKLTAYNESGEAREVEFNIMEEGSGWADSGPYIQQGSYLLVKASNQLVTGWEYVNEEAIPAKALELLKAQGGS
ncbi:MAG: YxeA family protein [Coriobacteriales bacterium]|jgi:uncharacterized protein (TIGR01655 family)|nr:YxeA family protein [Coriobacteriales bacterium]